MKKAVIASLAVLATAAVLATFALGGAGKFRDVQVNADPKEYSVTFDYGDSTTVEEVVDAEGDHNYAICTTTAAGNKVEVVGWYNEEARFTFKGVSFRNLRPSSTKALAEVGAYQFSTITGFAIFFSGGSVKFDADHTVIDSVESGKPYKELSINLSDEPGFFTNDSITVASLTIWYSC